MTLGWVAQTLTTGRRSSHKSDSVNLFLVFFSFGAGTIDALAPSTTIIIIGDGE